MNRAAVKEMDTNTAPKEIKYPGNTGAFYGLGHMLHKLAIFFFSESTNYDMKQEVTLSGLIGVKQMFSETKDSNEG